MPLPQRIAALPDFMPRDLKDAAPGHRFQLYLENWQGRNGTAFTPYKKARATGKGERAIFDQNCAGVLKDLCPLPATSQKVLAGLRTRQQHLIAHYGTNGYRISTTSTAPFATGLGNEHPIENGFAFLTPYGLPYLAGSGVKGILRRATQELRDEAEAGFTDDAIDAMFGPERIDKPEDASRGALDFWDVFPNPVGGKLAVEIMTPHFGKYYRGEDTPHDSGAPVPVSFLAVPAGSAFDFHAVCQAARLPTSLQVTWRNLLDRAFQHAFRWLGFGAKTSVGYGAMAVRMPNSIQSAASPGTTTATGAVPAIATAVVTASQSDEQTWPAATLTLNKSTGEVKASFDGKQTAGLKGDDVQADLKAALGDVRWNKLKSKAELKNVAVTVRKLGNSWLLKGLAEKP